MDLLSRVFFFSEFALLRAFLSAQKSTQGPTEPLWDTVVCQGTAQNVLKAAPFGTHGICLGKAQH